MKKEIILGSFGVDSGQVLIIDPCYLAKWKNGEVDFEKKEYINDYDEACKITCSKKMGGEHSKFGIVSSTGYGDGSYEVEATEENGRIKELRIKFF